ncbi:MAG TPA: MATE family efflux transporter, partial [Oribacterium sp.]|nr:MATE family efflux transporter [Oribacterium sp.]
MSKDECLLTDAPLRALTIFALPMILGSFFQQVYNMADSIIVGQYVGSAALAAVGACAALTNVFICVALGAGVGAGVLVSRAFGARNYPKMKTIVSTSLLSFLILSLVLGALGFALSRPMMQLLQTPSDILETAVLYLQVYFLGFPFLFMYNILSNMFTSIGESRIPLALLIFSSVLNIFMDLWMVASLGMGVFGAALATLISQGISAVFSLLIFLRRMRRYEGRFTWFDPKELHAMLQIAIPSVLQQSTVSIGMMIVQAVVNPFGTQALAGYSATMRVENVFSLMFVSIGNAVSPYVSQNLGAHKTKRIREGYRAALLLDACFALLAFVVIECFHTEISALFLGKDGTAFAYEVSAGYMKWLG